MKKTTKALSSLLSLGSLATLSALITMPVAALAVGKDINYLVGIVNRSFTTGVYLIISFSILTFVYNVYNYYIKADADRKEAGIYVLMSVIGFFVILSFWGLVNIVKNSLNLDTGAPAGLFGGMDNSSSGGNQSTTAPAPGGGSLGNSSTGAASGGGIFGNSRTGAASGGGNAGRSSTGAASGGGTGGNSNTGAASGGGVSVNPYNADITSLEQQIAAKNCNDNPLPEDVSTCENLSRERLQTIGNAHQWDIDNAAAQNSATDAANGECTQVDNNGNCVNL